MRIRAVKQKRESIPGTEAWFKTKRSQIEDQFEKVASLQIDPMQFWQNEKDIRLCIYAMTTPQTAKWAKGALLSEEELVKGFVKALDSAIDRVEKGDIPSEIMAGWRANVVIAKDAVKREQLLRSASKVNSPAEVEVLRTLMRHAAEHGESVFTQSIKESYSAIRAKFLEFAPAS